MIRRLRQQHRFAWALLLPILAVLLAVSLLSRPATPLADELPAPREHATEPAATPAKPEPRDEDR